MKMTRRDAGRTAVCTVLTGVSLAMAACAGKTQDQLQADIGLIASAANAVVIQLGAIPQIPAGIITQAETVVAQINTYASQIAAALTPSADVVKQVSMAVQVLGSLITPFFPLAVQIAATIQALLSMVPAILAEAGVQTKSAVEPMMSVEAARLRLRAATIR